MGLFKWFGGKTAAEHEIRADAFADEAAWGKAKLEYERALEKLESQPQQVAADTQRVQEKVRQSRLALAEDHLNSSRDLIAAGYHEDAADLLELALELSGDSPIREKISALLRQSRPAAAGAWRSDDEAALEMDETDRSTVTVDDHFLVLSSMLPEPLQEIYSGYGAAFRQGYVALHQGEFQQAAAHLEQALQAGPEDRGYILLELASAYYNLDRLGDARRLAEEFSRHHPDALPGYQLLCEIYWELNEFDDARRLLALCPKTLHATAAYVILFGETLRREAGCARAADWFDQHLRKHGWNDKIALALAGVYEQTGDTDQALDLYTRYIGNCRGCGSATPPEVERKYADLSFADGNTSDEILELYLALARKDPAHAADYYVNVSRIYEKRGNPTEALRFESIAKQASNEG